MDVALARFNMVSKQILPNRVSDPLVLEAMGRLPRELFVPPGTRALAYADTSVPLENGRSLLSPMTIAHMLQIAHVCPQDTCLDIGCATGYSTALLAELSQMVVALESDANLAARAESILTELDIDNAAVLTGPLAEGCPKQAPFDLIFIGGTLPQIPDNLCRQLSDGGRLICAVNDGGIKTLVLVERYGDTFGRKTFWETDAPVLPGFEPAPAFVF